MFLVDNRYELRNEVGTVSDYYRASNGDYVVHCQAKEGDSTLIELNISTQMCIRDRLTIGSHSFIDTFEEQLIGKKVGEEVEVNVTFPEQYQAKELAGKPAMFKVTIKEIKVKEYPELDDDFAQDRCV